MQYQPLKSGEIRLLYFDTGGDNRRVRCDLVNTVLGTSPYYALSYVWGTEMGTESIIVNGQQFWPTKNLGYALEWLQDVALRDAWGDLSAAKKPAQELKASEDGDAPHRRAIWIDALCINQADQAEKTEQVGRMTQVFSNAETVFCWLGRPDGRFCYGFMFMQKLVEMTRDNISELEIDSAMDGIPGGGARKIVDVLDRDFFRRIWTLQEVALARKAILVYDGQSVDWHEFCTAMKGIEWLSTMRDFVSLDKALSKTGHRERAIDQGPLGPPLLETLANCSSRNATDPRDKIYGLLGLCRREGFEADYSESVSETYCRLVEHLMRWHRNLDVLSAVQYNCLRRDEIPSWAPDWRNQRSGYLLLNQLERCSYNASGNTEPLATFYRGEAGRKLMLRGIKVDTIEGWTEDTSIKEWALPDYEGLHSSWRLWNTRSRPHGCPTRHGQPFPPGPLPLAFARVLTANQTLEGTRGAFRMFERRPHPGAYLADWWAHKYIQPERSRFSEISGISRFCITKSGLPGRVPRGAESGDVIVVLAGGKVPYVIRKLENQDVYEFVGDCCEYQNYLSTKEKFQEQYRLINLSRY